MEQRKTTLESPGFIFAVAEYEGGKDTFRHKTIAEITGAVEHSQEDGRVTVFLYCWNSRIMGYGLGPSFAAALDAAALDLIRQRREILRFVRVLRAAGIGPQARAHAL